MIFQDLAKGDYVTFGHKGVLITARVVTKPKSLRVTLRTATDEWKVDARILTKIPPPPLPDAGPMTGYSVRGYKVCKWASEETLCFQCEVVKDGIAVAHISNDGHGGCDLVRSCPGNASHYHTFEAAVRAWGTWAGFKDTIDIAGQWIHWELEDRPFGKTAQACAADFEKTLADMGQKPPA